MSGREPGTSPPCPRCSSPDADRPLFTGSVEVRCRKCGHGFHPNQTFTPLSTASIYRLAIVSTVVLVPGIAAALVMFIASMVIYEPDGSYFCYSFILKTVAGVLFVALALITTSLWFEYYQKKKMDDIR